MLQFDCRNGWKAVTYQVERKRMKKVYMVALHTKQLKPLECSDWRDCLCEEPPRLAEGRIITESFDPRVDRENLKYCKK